MGNNVPTVQQTLYGSNNTNLNMGTSAVPYYGINPLSGSVFNNSQALGYNYSNDLMMPDFLKQGYCEYPTTAQYGNTTSRYQALQPQSANSGQANPAFQGQYYNILNQNDDTKASTAGKKTGAIFGALLPLVHGIVKVVKGEKASDVFKLKSLGVKIPVLAIAGWAVGALIDGLTKPDTQEPETQTQNQTGVQYQQQTETA